MKREVEFWHFYTNCFFIGVNRFSNTNLEMSVLIKREERSVRVFVRSSQMVCLCYCSCDEKR